MSDKPNPAGSNHRQWVRAVVDYAAPLAFAATFYGAPLLGVSSEDRFMLATWVLVAASALALAVGYLVERRVAPLPLFAGGLALVFGGLTLAFDDARFVKIKVTVVNGLLASALLGGWALRRNFMRPLFGEAIRLPDAAWRVLMLRYGAWFALIAVVNEIVWRTQPDGTWVTFRTLLLPAAIAFSLLQLPFMLKHMEKDAPEPPEPGF